MPSFFLNTYGPLALTKLGRQAAFKYSLPPFVDGSIRREPDLEHEYPAITCLCRTNKFAPRLEAGDVVAYMLKKANYGMGYKHQRMTAVLRVIEVMPTHAVGAQWYRKRRMRLPNNCIVPRNKANPLSKSHQKAPKREHGCAKPRCSQWDDEYKKRAKRWGTFVVCERLFVNLDWDAPEVSEKMLKAAFGKVPGTLNPKKQKMKAGQRLVRRLGLAIVL